MTSQVSMQLPRWQGLEFPHTVLETAMRQRRAAGTVVAFLVTGRMPRLAASPSHPCHTSTGAFLPISPTHPIPHSYEEGTSPRLAAPLPTARPSVPESWAGWACLKER